MNERLINKAVFSMKTNEATDVAFMAYNLPSVIGEDGMMECALNHLWFGERASEVFKKVFCEEVPVRINYKRGAIPMEFGHWRRAKCAIKDISEYDVTFDKFWNVYGHKIGNKAGVMKKWNKLVWEDRIMAIGSIPRLRNYYQSKGFEMPYPETYINQRRWENEF